MTVFTESARWGEAIMSEANFHLSRDNGIVALSQTVLMNGLVSKLAIVAGVDVVQSYVGTGNGVMTMANPAVNTMVQDGNYKLSCTTAVTNGGIFRVEDPGGKSLGYATVGVLFNKEIKFTIADGATDFVVGDEFTINIAANADDFQYVAFNPAGTDGSQNPVGYSPYPIITDGVNTKKIAVLTNNCELNGNCIAWPAGITLAQKNDAIQALNAKTIKVRY